MATTIFTQPPVVQPVYNNLVYEFSATTQATKYKFRYVVDVYVEDTIIGTFKITPQADYGRFDVAEVLRDYLTSRPINTGCQVTTESTITTAEWGSLKDDIHDYYIIVKTEYADQPTGIPSISGPTATGTTAYSYNGIREWFDGKSFDMSNYLLSNLTVPTAVPAPHHRFLTLAPRNQYITDDDWCTLTGLNTLKPLYNGNTYDTYSQPVYSMTVEFYDNEDVFISSAETYNITGNCGNYPNSSSVTAQTANYLENQLQYAGTGPKNLEQQGITIPSNWQYYRVWFNGYQSVCRTVNFRNDTLGVITFTITNCSNVPVSVSLDSGTNETYCMRGFVSPPSGVITTYTDYCTPDTENQYFDTERISEYFYYYKDPECGPSSQRVVFMNSFGTYDYFTFKGRDTVGYDMNRNSFERASELSNTRWSTDKYYGWNNERKVYQSSLTKTGILYSGRISKSYLAWLTDELLKSPSVYLMDSDGDLQPIVLTNTEVVEPNFQRNDGEYEINLEYVGGYNETIQIKQ